MAIDEAEEMRRRDLARRRNTPELGGLFEIQHPAPSVPSPASEHAADALTFTEKGRNRRAKQLLQVLEIIGSRESGYTGDEIDAALGLGSGSICARIDDLRGMGYIDTSETIKRKTRRQFPAAVQFITPKGRERLREAKAAA